MGAIEEWLQRHRSVVLVVVAAAALAVRALLFVELAGGPAAKEHLWPEWDMEFFDRWAKGVAAGDVVGTRPFHPFHSWHARVAAAHLASRPDDPLAARFAAAPDAAAKEAVERELWVRWYGGTRFHQEPLYAYALGLLYRVAGPDVRWAFAVQLLLGVGSCLLVCLLARRAFGDLAGAVAGGLAVACSPPLLYEMVLLRTAPLGFLTLAIGLVSVLALERGSRWLWFADGLLLGAGLLLQSSLVLLLAGVVALLAWEGRALPRRLAASAAALAAGVALPLVPLVGRNVAVGAPPLSVTSIGAITFACANAADVSPDAGFVISRFAPRVMGASDGAFLGAVRETLATHAGIGSVVRLVAGKVATLLHWYEIPNNASFYLYREQAPVLRILPVTFTVAGPLGLAGCLLALRERRARVLILLAAVSAAPMLVFYVLSRFRAPLLLVLLPFAALALVRVAGWAAGRRPGPAAATAGLIVALLAFVARPLPEGRPLVRVQDHAVQYEVHFGPLADEAEKRGDAASVVRLLGEFLRLEPAEMRRLSPQMPPLSAVEAAAARSYGAVHTRLGAALEATGDAAGAARERERGRELEALSRLPVPG